MRLRLKQLIVSFILFFFVYDVQIKGVPTILSSRKWSLVLLIAFSVIHFKDYGGIVLRLPNLRNAMGAIYKSYIAGIVFVWLYSFLIAIINGRMGDSYVDFKNLVFFLLFSVIAPAFLCSLFRDKEELFSSLILVGMIQATIVYLLFVSASLRELFDAFFHTDARFGYLSGNIKVLGLGSGGAALSVLLFLSMYSAGFFLINEKRIITSAFSFIYILGASFFTGRTGFFAGIILLLIIFYKRLGHKIKASSLMKGLIVIIGLFIAGSVAMRYISGNESLLTKALNLFKHLGISETLSKTNDSSYLYVISKMNFPDVSAELLYGAGYGRGLSATGVNVQNDIGYVQRIFSLGIFVGIIFYIVNLWCYWKLSKCVKSKEYRFYYRILIITIFILELKESFFYYYLVPSIILLLGLMEMKAASEKQSNDASHKCIIVNENRKESTLNIQLSKEGEKKNEAL